MQDFFIDGVHQMCEGANFHRPEQNFIIGQINQISWKLSTDALKLIKI